MTDAPKSAEENGEVNPAATPKSSAEKGPLFTPVDYLKWVNPNRGILLRKLGLFRAVDLLFFFPRTWEDLTLIRKIADLEEDVLQTVVATVNSYSSRFTRRGTLTSLYVSDDSGVGLEGLWFNQGWMAEKFAAGKRVLVTGKPVWKEKGFWQMTHPRLIWFGEESESVPNADSDVPASGVLPPNSPELDPFLPVYPLTEGLTSYHLQRIIRPLLETLPDLLDEVFPTDYLRDHDLLSIAEAVRRIHFPRSVEEGQMARRRFIYQELFLLQLGLSIRRKQHEVNLKSPALPWTAQVEGRIRRVLPFDLTGAQKRVIGEIADDMSRPVPMNRLLQGDVGSGKTAVALAAVLQAVAAGYQAVFMAPTEVLARQHLRTLTRWLEGSRVNVVPLIGGQKGSERSAILADIQSGAANIVIGTQAIICGDLQFAKLGLVVIDEQHKFGVRQRAKLKTGTDADPHYLVMSATPIPRSITMTLFGDLDVSILDELPPGRQTVRTWVVDEEDRAAWWDFFRKKLYQGRQGYIVVPRIEETDDELASAEAVFEELSKGELAGFRIAILHGRMNAAEKEQIMLDFRSGAIQTLVSTTVIEVGVDIPNATLMTIMEGRRFGLAQLHQLRGRIGRGKFPGFCAVFPGVKKETDPEENGDYGADPAMRELARRVIQGTKRKKKEAAGKPGISAGLEGDGSNLAEDAEKKKDLGRERLEIFAKSTDGFFLAERDFEIRGPGELFGMKQHGLAPFKIANLVRDRETLLEARKDALELVAADPGLATAEHHRLRQQVLSRYGRVLELGDVG